jgi:hypothetical protein
MWRLLWSRCRTKAHQYSIKVVIYNERPQSNGQETLVHFFLFLPDSGTREPQNLSKFTLLETFTQGLSHPSINTYTVKKFTYRANVRNGNYDSKNP